MTGFAGTLCERLALERRSDTRDALGGATGDWSQVALIWAAVRPNGADAAVEGDARVGIRRWIVEARPFDARVGDRLMRMSGNLLVTSVLRDPATLDRITLFAEDLP